MTLEVRMLGPGDDAVLSRLADGVFDHAIIPGVTAEFLADPRHHLCVAIEDGGVVGMASAVHYVHPDKPTELWINEVGVAPSHHRRGIGKLIMTELLAHARALGAHEAWVLTDVDNAAARALYGSVGGEEQPAGLMVTYYLTDRAKGRHALPDR